MIEAVIFDIKGTIVHSVNLHVKAWKDKGLERIVGKTSDQGASYALDCFGSTCCSMGLGLGHPGRRWNDPPVASCCCCGRDNKDPAQRSAERFIKIRVGYFADARNDFGSWIMESINHGFGIPRSSLLPLLLSPTLAAPGLNNYLSFLSRKSGVTVFCGHDLLPNDDVDHRQRT